VTNTIINATKAYVTGGSIDVTGDLTVKAQDNSTSSAIVGSASAAVGLISVSMGGSIASAAIASTVDAYLNVPTVHAGDITVMAKAVPSADVFAFGVNAGTLAVGLSAATAIVTPNVDAWVSGNITADSLLLEAFLAKPATGYSAEAEATGSAGGLIGIDATVATAKTIGSVTSYVKDGAVLVIAGSTMVAAAANSKQRAEANSNTAGLVAVGISTSKASSNITTKAFLGTPESEVDCNVNLTGGSLSVSAVGTDDNFADTTAGSVGGISVAAATAETSTISTTIAEIKAGADIDLSGASATGVVPCRGGTHCEAQQQGNEPRGRPLRRSRRGD